MSFDFDEFLQDSKIIKNRNVLHPSYIPETLPFREEHIKSIMRFVAPTLKKERIGNMLLYGKSGTGKTSSVKHVQRLYNQRAKNSAMIYLNCRLSNRTSYQIILKTLQKIKGQKYKQGFGLDVFLSDLISELKDRYLILILDEIDAVKDLDKLVYTLTRINDEVPYTGGVSLIGLTNKLMFKDKLDARTRSSLNEKQKLFNAYDAQELNAIVRQRADLAFYPDTISPSAINLIGALSAKTGDARYALKLLLSSAELAEANDLEKITEKEINQAKTLVEVDIVKEAIDKLPQDHKLALIALADLMIHGGKYTKLGDHSTSERPFITGDVYEAYRSKAKSIGMVPKTSRTFSSILTDLETLGLVILTETGPGIRGHSRFIRLTHQPNEIYRLLKRSLEGV